MTAPGDIVTLSAGGAFITMPHRFDSIQYLSTDQVALVIAVEQSDHMTWLTVLHPTRGLGECSALCIGLNHCDRIVT